MGKNFSPLTLEYVQVANWMHTFNQETPDQPTIPSRKIQKFRMNLSVEELIELYDLGCKPSNLIEVADAFTDRLFVLLGDFIAFGLTLPDLSNRIDSLLLTYSNVNKHIPEHWKEITSRSEYFQNDFAKLMKFKIDWSNKNQRIVDLIPENLSNTLIGSEYIPEIKSLFVTRIDLLLEEYAEFGLLTILEPLFDEVLRSNMSKACKSLQEAQETADYYSSDHGNMTITPKNGLFLVSRTLDGKIMKSIYYSPADLAPIVLGLELSENQF